MAKYTDDKKRILYESYKEYVGKQDARSHDYDCLNCLRINMTNVNIALELNPYILFVLDIGSRDSAYFDEIGKSGIICKGIDISPKSVEYAKSKNRDVVLGDAKDISQIFKDHKFDLIISCHTLEHFLEPKKIIKSCYDLLKNNGLILIRLPDEGPEIRDVRLLYAHTRTWTWNEVSTLLTESGFLKVAEKREFQNEIFIIAKKPVKIPVLEDIPLYFVSNDNWMPKYNEVMKDPFIQKKYDRKRRLKDKIDYVRTVAQEIVTPGYVVDLGPGPGEFLEVCRYYGNKIKGIDSALNENLMGFEYLDLSILMTQRQQLPVEYLGFENLLSGKLPWDDNELSFVNSQGSIEQIFCQHITGDMRDRVYTNVYWTMNSNMCKVFTKLFSEVKRCLKKSGIFLIVANGTANTKDYSQMIEDCAAQYGLEMLSVPKPYSSYEFRVHKMRKI